MASTGIDRRALPAGATLTRWAAADGSALRRMALPAADGVAPRGSLLFAGGRGDFIEKYLEPALHWRGRGWTVSAFDWRGQGGSRRDEPRGHLDSFDPLVGDGAALIGDWMGEAPGPHVAVAHSMGGHLLLRILAEHRPPLAAAALVAPMLGFSAGVPPWLGRMLAEAMRLAGRSRRPAWNGAERPGHERQAILTSCAQRYADEQWWKAQQPSYDLGAPTWGWLAAAYRSMAALDGAALRGISVPLLILAAERDRLVSAAAIRAAASSIPRAQLHVYSDAAHEILRESDPIRLDALARIDRFLEAAGA